MALRKYKPTTAGTRWRIGNAYEEVTTSTPEKTLVEKQKSTAGRNAQGRRSMRYMGSGNKTMYRIIDFKRDKKNIPAVVKTIEYDPNRTAFIALLAYADGEKRYIIAPQGLQVGQTVVSGDDAAPELGNALMLKNMPLGTNVHNIEMQPGKKRRYIRSIKQQRRKIRHPENAKRRIKESADQLLCYRRCGEQQRSQPRKHG